VLGQLLSLATDFDDQRQASVDMLHSAGMPVCVDDAQ